MLTGSAQSYSLGSRSKTNYNMSLSEIRTAIQKLEEEIEELEGLISGKSSRKVMSIIPRFWDGKQKRCVVWRTLFVYYQIHLIPSNIKHEWFLNNECAFPASLSPSLPYIQRPSVNWYLPLDNCLAPTL